ncbi:glucan biosynthesis protein G [Marinobacter sp. M216]|uniref:Glucans biosynthesis protein G n=1 Tax=Marinobacter albus TaxID=3030833 RepID=A0ABT7HBD5_9GAMM|nr:glucan biosynthesis protein G [Marinobacter sp. M216]MDK9557649.1 glucan biosynthesis protein G [Marinobacter sp. M216]
MTLPRLVYGFDFNDVEQKAEALAGAEFEAPQEVPDFLRELSPSQHRSIQFDPNAALWRESGAKFRVTMMAPGSFYAHPVRLNEVKEGNEHPIPFRREAFTYPDKDLMNRIPADLGYAGFKVTYPFSGSDVREQFLVFGGASYFRGMGENQRLGISARGIAINTGLASGEQFPSFTEFWLQQPATGDDSMVVFALLDGASITGAYRFVIQPGSSTRVDVTAKLFFREDIEQLGLAPLTSMFFYGENSLKPLGQWRPEVHDSDGLLVHDVETGEWLWRPLLNPKKLRMSYHQVGDLEGFGLMQRDQQFESYEDVGYRYDVRPSAWVESGDGWGTGNVVLVELPTEEESNDNIVAFWKPDSTFRAGETLDFNYRVSFGGPDISGQKTGRAIPTFFGSSEPSDDNPNAYRFVVDFESEELSGLSRDAPVVSNVSGGEGVEILEHFVQFVEAKDMWRLSILARPEPGKVLSLRAFLSLDGAPMTETWIYELGSDNNLMRQSE